MAHKTLIGGTAYEISGGKTLVNGTAYSIDKGKTLVGGTAYEVGFVSIQPSEYLTFSSNSTIALSVASPNWDGTMYYSTDATKWKKWDGGEISANIIYLCGVGNTKVTGNASSYKWTLTGTGISCNGNIETLLDYATVEAGGHPPMADYCYYYMFYNCTELTSAPSLPATTLTTCCYSNMFTTCTGLTSAPSLPATTLATSCYSSMFSGCKALTSAPSLPATTLMSRCYAYMFQNCSALTSAPSLPATTLQKNCYQYMFSGCKALTSAPSLPATTLANYCYERMFGGCKALTSAPSLPATTLANYCCREMFAGCTGLTAIPRLPATTLQKFCYQYMFEDCTKIKLSSSQTGAYTKAYRIPHSGTGTTASSALSDMFKNTGGTFTGTPSINTTYYLDSSNTIV